MVWPNDSLTTDHFDAGADSPAKARSVLKRLIDVTKAVLAARSAANGLCELDANRKVPDARIGRGQPGGVASLDANGTVPQAQLPGGSSGGGTTGGALRRATNAEVTSGSGDGLVAANQLARRTATQTRKGLVELATASETIAGADSSRAVHPAGLKAALAAFQRTDVQVATRDEYSGSGPNTRLSRCALEVSKANNLVTITLVNHYQRYGSEGRN